MQFDFGKNWTNFSKKALDDRRIQQARTDFNQLLSGLNLAGQRFVDIGFGQGLSLLLAKEAGAQVVGCDINKNCLEALRQTSRFFPGMQIDDIPLVIGSILETGTVDRLKTLGEHERYDVVHSWGVLHHTGHMSRAIAHAARLVKPSGKFIIAIYNRHWSSPLWLIIKRLYCNSPDWVQRIMIGLFFPIICIAKFLITGKNPIRQERGMDFFMTSSIGLAAIPMNMRPKKKYVPSSPNSVSTANDRLLQPCRQVAINSFST